jgi:hypothetical protein
LPSFLFSDPWQPVWVRAERPGDRDIFCDIEPSLSALVLRDERLRSPQLHRQLRLRDPGFLPRLDQAGQGPVIKVGEKGVHWELPDWDRQPKETENGIIPKKDNLV